MISYAFDRMETMTIVISIIIIIIIIIVVAVTLLFFMELTVIICMPDILPVV
jgi:hypothetical protein